MTGAQQDSGAVAVRSRGKFAEISMRDWEPIGAGGESGYTAGDPLHPGNHLRRRRARASTSSATSRSLAPRRRGCRPASPRAPTGRSRSSSRRPIRVRCTTRNQYLFKSTDGAADWTQISADLTRADPGVPATLDAAAAADTDRNGKRGVIYTIAPSPLLVADALDRHRRRLHPAHAPTTARRGTT